MIRKIISTRTGGSAVEFAIVLPLLLILVFGIIEFSLIMYNKAVITNASREGARAGIVRRYDPTTNAYAPFGETEVKNIVSNYCGSYMVGFGSKGTTPQAAVSWNPPLASPPVVDNSISLTVNVSYDYYFLVLPNFISAIGNPIHLEAQTVMRME